MFIFQDHFDQYLAFLSRNKDTFIEIREYFLLDYESSSKFI